jgi:hypothetical protein
VQVGTTPIFLLDFNRKRIHGVFVAAAAPDLDINPDAWKGQGPRHHLVKPG